MPAGQVGGFCSETRETEGGEQSVLGPEVASELCVVTAAVLQVLLPAAWSVLVPRPSKSTGPGTPRVRDAAALAT